MKKIIVLFVCLIAQSVFAQEKTSFNFNKLYSYALQGNVKSIIEQLDTLPDERLNTPQIKEKQQFMNRFKYRSEKYDYKTADPEIIELTNIYHRYWNYILLQQKTNAEADSLLQKDITQFLSQNNRLKKSDLKNIDSDFTGPLSSFLKNKGYYSALGKTAGIFDLLLWREENNVIYKTELPEKTQKVKVVFMDQSISWGWEEYATFGKYYPGGWATDKELHCVKKAYNLNSEDFKVSYLKHEGMHFSDYKLHPGLTGTELEYRAKLVELSYADSTLQRTIQFFILNGADNPQSPHSYANFLVMKDLSQKIFGNKTETDYELWKNIPSDRIHTMALQLIKEDDIRRGKKR